MLPETRTYHEPAKSPRKSGWTAERRAKHAAAIREWKPWSRSTGPRTVAGKARSSLNAYKHGLRSAVHLRFLRALRNQARFVRDVEHIIRLERLREKQKNLTNELLALPTSHLQFMETPPIKSALGNAMNTQTRDILLTAWRENRLAGVHVDLQTGFLAGSIGFDVRRTPILGPIKSLAAGLRQRDVLNLWVTLYRQDDAPPRNLCVEAFNNHCAPISPLLCIDPRVAAEGSETVLTKRSCSALQRQSSALPGFLEETGIDTLLVTGVNAKACVGETLAHGVQSRTLTVIAVTDCINHHEPSGEDYKKSVMKQFWVDAALYRHFHIADHAAVLETLTPMIGAQSGHCKNQHLTV